MSLVQKQNEHKGNIYVYNDIYDNMLCFKLLSKEFYIFQRTILSCRFINLFGVQADTTSIARDCIEELTKKLTKK